MTEPMTRQEAIEYCPQWGSMMTGGDPGACMYGFDDKGRPANPVSRDAILDWIDSHCLPAAQGRIDSGKADEAEMEDVDKLNALRAYIAAFTFPEPYQFGEPAEVNGHDVAEFARHYIIAMLWSSTDESDESGGLPMDQNYDASDIAPATMAEIEKICRAFLEQVGHLITDENYIGHASEGALQQAGHDLWLTSAGHGAGFWDGDWASDADRNVGRPMTDAAKAQAQEGPYIGDDGMIYLY